MARKQQLPDILDETLRIKRWPRKESLRAAALAYLAAKFRRGGIYTEAAVNTLLCSWHTFGDPALLRRELYDRGFLDRTRDGRSYWATEPTPTAAEDAG